MELISLGIAVIVGAGAIFAGAAIIYVGYITYKEVKDWVKGRIAKTNSKDRVKKIIVEAKENGKYSIRQINLKTGKVEGEIIADQVNKKLKKIKNKGKKGETFKG